MNLFKSEGFFRPKSPKSLTKGASGEIVLSQTFLLLIA